MLSYEETMVSAVVWLRLCSAINKFSFEKVVVCIGF